MLLIELSVAKRMIADVEPDQKECCGFFFGHANTINRTVTKSLMATNSTPKDKCTNFAISSQDYLQAECIAQKENLSFLGIYHSHPNRPAVPSEYDQEMAFPWFSYIIISVINKKFKKIRSWQLNGHLYFQEEEIAFIQSSLN